MNNVRVEPIAIELIEQFHAAVGLVARERLWLAFTDAPPIESTQEFVRSNIAGDVPQFVALDGDQVVGWCDILPKRLEGFRHSGVLGMGLIAEYRGRGIGTRLVTEAMDKARRKGLERVELEAYVSNVPAVRLYEKLGFHVEGRKVRARKLNGHYDDILCMALILTTQ